MSEPEVGSWVGERALVDITDGAMLIDSWLLTTSYGAKFSDIDGDLTTDALRLAR